MKQYLAIFLLINFCFVTKIYCSDSLKSGHIERFNTEKFDCKYNNLKKGFADICNRKDHCQNVQDLNNLYSKCDKYSQNLPPIPRPFLWLAGIPSYYYFSTILSHNMRAIRLLYICALCTTILFIKDSYRVFTNDENIEKQKNIKILMEDIDSKIIKEKKSLKI